MKKLYIASFLLSLSLHAQNFLHTQGKEIVDGNGKEIILRGLGLGGWMVQEGYMLQTSGFAGPQHVIKEKIEDLIGEENTKEFYKRYLKNGITKRDIDSLKAWGFNSIRLPMHYDLYTLPIESEKNNENTWLEKGFQMTDSLLNWCEANRMYLILDLHAAPGGQGHDANISDYDSKKPSLWESEENQKKMVDLWKKLAERYKDEVWIGGYDIINEPNWNFTEGANKNGLDEKNNAPLRKLMVDVTKAIREVDRNHIIIIEGNGWGNNYESIFPLWDDNMVISFHKYWNYNTQEAIQFILNFRDTYQAPIWLGESGENSNVWFRDAIALMEKNHIGWAFWPMKKVENIAGVTSVRKNDGYQKLLDYWEHGGEKPDVDFAKQALFELADNYKIENVTVKPDVIDAMFRQVTSTQIIPYKNNVIPGRIFATEYDLGTQGYAYSDTEFVNYRVSTGKNVRWNTGNQMRNDGVDISKCSDAISNGYQITDIEKEEWLLYTVNISEEGTYEILIRYSNNTQKDGKLHLEFSNNIKTPEIILEPITGQSETYKTAKFSKIFLKEGEQQLKLLFDSGEFELNYIEFLKQ